MAPEPAGAAWDYHLATKHTPAQVRNDSFQPDWSNQPRPFKLYRNLPAIPLPAEALPRSVPAFDAIAGSVRGPRQSTPDLPTLAAILRYSSGIIKRLRYAGGVMDFRAAPSTGALYHLELYLVCTGLPGLEAGVYHFGSPDLTLTRLRQGDWRGTLASASGGEPAAVEAPAMLICTSTYWRNAWRYRERAFRHSFWDSGTLLANLLAVAGAHGVPAHLITGFVDQDVSRLLGLDSPREVATCLVALGEDPDRGSVPGGPMPPLAVETVQASGREQPYLIVEAAYAASRLAGPEAVAVWREQELAIPLALPGDATVRFDPVPAEDLPAMTVEEVIRQRRSARRFSEAAIEGRELALLIETAMRDIPADYPGSISPSLSRPYLIVNAVRGLDPGAYVYHAEAREFELLKEGQFRETAAVLALDQPRAGFAAASVYFLTDLAAVLAALGNRGYGVAQLDGAIRGGRLYLGAYALGLGATALTFYDDAVIRFFSPHAAGRDAGFLVALGRLPR
jgi:SagB-type dehydrogenase family enzyme